MKLKCLLLALVALGLSGCYSVRGPLRPVLRDGTPADLSADHVNTSIFRADYDAALALRTGAAPPAADKADTAYHSMMASGFMYNYAFCQDFFDEMGHNQRNSHVMRAALPSIITLITGVIGLHDFTNNPEAKGRWIQGLAIGSGTTTAVLNVYDEHFLFGTDNIYAVETMTLKSLSAHGAAAMKQQYITFEQATMHLIDNQAQCSPQAILLLARTTMHDTNLKGTNQGVPAAGKSNSDDQPGKVTVQVAN